MAVSAWVTNVRSGFVSMIEVAAEVLEREAVGLVRARERERRASSTWRGVGRRSCADPRAVRVVQRLAGDLEADPLAEDLDLAARPDRRPSGGRYAYAIERSTAKP